MADAKPQIKKKKKKIVFEIRPTVGLIAGMLYMLVIWHDQIGKYYLNIYWNMFYTANSYTANFPNAVWLLEVALSEYKFF